MPRRRADQPERPVLGGLAGAAERTWLATRNDQHVGFRALFFKEARRPSTERSAPPGTYLTNAVESFALQGPANRSDDEVAAVRQGAQALSNINGKAPPASVAPGLTTFPIFEWASTNRAVTDAYHLVFDLRPDVGQVDPLTVNAVGHGTLKPALRGDDLKERV